MRKLLLALAVLLVLLVAAVVVVPVFFQERVLAEALDAANEELDATVSIDGVSLSLLRSFPHPDVALRGVRVVGHEPFEGVELASIDELRVVVGLGSLLGGEAYELRKVALDGARFDLRVDGDGHANWDLAPSDGEEEAANEDEESSAFAMDLQGVHLTDLQLRYDDQEAGLFVEIDDLDHQGGGTVRGDELAFQNLTTVEALTVRDGGIAWLNDAKIWAHVAVAYNLTTGRIAVDESSLHLNALRLGFAGLVEPQGDDLALDLSFRTLETSFESILSLVPGVYTEDFLDVQTEGTLALEASVQGVLPAEGDDLPGFELELAITDASFQMPDLPSAVTGIQLDLSAAHPGGDPDRVAVDLERFRMVVAGSPLGGRMKLRSPVSDPDVDLALQGRIDLAELRRALPLEGVDYAGVLDLDLAVAGRVSDFEDQQLDKVTASGRFALQDAVYEDEALPVPLEISSMRASLSPRSSELSELKMTLGDSDLSGSGRLDTLVPWLFSDAALEGQLSVRSSRFDTQPWLEDDGDGEEAVGGVDDGGSSLVAVPTDLDLGVEAHFDSVQYGEIELTDMVGSLQLRGGAARIEDLDFSMLGGRVSLSGAYEAPTDQRADVALTVDMSDFEVSQVAASFETLRRIAPVVENASGRFSTDFELETTLGPDLTPDLPTLISAGLLKSKSLVMRPGFMEKFGGHLGNKRFATLDLSKGEMGFRIRNGKARIEPASVKIGGSKGTLSGSVGVLDESLDLVLDLTVPTRFIEASDLLTRLGNIQGKSVDLQAVIGGTYKQPTVKLGAPGLADSVRDAVTEEIKERVDEVVDGLLEEAKAAGDKLIAEAEEKAEQLVAVAEAQGEKLKEEAKQQGKELKNKAEGNPIKELAAEEAAKQLRKQARNAAKKLVEEAEEKGAALVDAAKTQRDRLIAEAETKAGM